MKTYQKPEITVYYIESPEGIMAVSDNLTIHEERGDNCQLSKENDMSTSCFEVVDEDLWDEDK